MPIILSTDTERPSESEGMASLQVASSHLSTLLGATDSLDSKVMFLAAVNLALFAAFIGAVVGLSLSAWLTFVPGVIACAGMLLAWLCVKPRTILQFNDPDGLLQNRKGGWTDHILAWYYIEAVSEASGDVEREISRKGRFVRLVAFMLFLHVLAVVASAGYAWSVT